MASPLISPTNSPPSPKPNKRRSSFINRRESLIVPNVVQENLLKTQQDEDTAEKEMYLKKLENEKAAWKRLYQESMSKYNDLKWKIKHDSADPIPISQCFELLDDRAKEFIKQKPDLTKMREEAKEYCQDTNDVLTMWKELETRSNRVMEVVAERLGDLERQTLETSTFIS